MEQRIFIKIAIREGFSNIKIIRKLVDHDMARIFFYLQVCYWDRQYVLEQEKANDPRKSGKARGFYYI
jgi:hypothetical protein